MTETKTEKTLAHRNEFLFIYDIKMGNPNGDPEENRPRRLPDNTFFVTDVRLKRFVRDYLKQCGNEILVDKIEHETTNLTGRVAKHLKDNNCEKANGKELVTIILKAFIDARLFGSALAFKAEDNNKYEPIPKTLTGPVQINMGEVLNRAEEIDIHGTTTFGSNQDKTQGTFTQTFVLRYGIIGFSGIANEHSAKISLLSDEDYSLFLKAMWRSVRENANTRSKKGQMPLLLINIQYKENTEFQLGRLHDYVKLIRANDKTENEWSKPSDFQINLDLLEQHIKNHKDKIEKISYQRAEDCQVTNKEIFNTTDSESAPNSLNYYNLNLDNLLPGQE